VSRKHTREKRDARDAVQAKLATAEIREAQLVADHQAAVLAHDEALRADEAPARTRTLARAVGDLVFELEAFRRVVVGGLRRELEAAVYLADMEARDEDFELLSRARVELANHLRGPVARAAAALGSEVRRANELASRHEQIALRVGTGGLPSGHVVGNVGTLVLDEGILPVRALALNPVYLNSIRRREEEAAELDAQDTPETQDQEGVVQ
jgi:hypothetical protein